MADIDYMQNFNAGLQQGMSLVEGIERLKNNALARRKLEMELDFAPRKMQAELASLEAVTRSNQLKTELFAKYGEKQALAELEQTNLAVTNEGLRQKQLSLEIERSNRDLAEKAEFHELLVRKNTSETRAAELRLQEAEQRLNAAPEIVSLEQATAKENLAAAKADRAQKLLLLREARKTVEDRKALEASFVSQERGALRGMDQAQAAVEVVELSRKLRAAGETNEYILSSMDKLVETYSNPTILVNVERKDPTTGEFVGYAQMQKPLKAFAAEVLRSPSQAVYDTVLDQVTSSSNVTKEGFDKLVASMAAAQGKTWEGPGASPVMGSRDFRKLAEELKSKEAPATTETPAQPVRTPGELKVGPIVRSTALGSLIPEFKIPKTSRAAGWIEEFNTTMEFILGRYQ